MHITKPGPITDRILMLGREESCVYLIKGEEYTIIGGGLIYIVPDVLDQLKSFGIDESRITRLLILHSHFDHVGIVSYLQKRLDHLKVCASPRAQELLAKPKVVETIKNYNQGLIAMHKMEDTVKKLGITADKILVDEAVSGGDKVNWGGVDFEIIDAPGHSSCSIGAYMPKDKTLFASDAGGIPFGGEIFASGNSNFTKYQETLERFAAFDVEIHCAAHYGAFTEDDGRNFMKRSIDSAVETRKILEESYMKTKDIEKSTAEITEMLMENTTDYFLPRSVIEMTIGQIMKHIAKTIDGV